MSRENENIMDEEDEDVVLQVKIFIYYKILFLFKSTFYKISQFYNNTCLLIESINMTYVIYL